MNAPADHFTPAQAATMLGVTEGTLKQYRTRGKGPTFVHIGRSVFYPAAAMASFIETRRGRGRPVTE